MARHALLPLRVRVPVETLHLEALVVQFKAQLLTISEDQRIVTGT